MKGLLIKISFNNELLNIFTNNQSAIHLSKNHVYYDGTKHVDIKFHFCEEHGWDKNDKTD